MEVTKRYPLVNMYTGSGDVRCYNSLTRSSHSWPEWLNRLRHNKKPEMKNFLERAYSSVVSIHKVLSKPEESINYYCPEKTSRYSSWKSPTEHLKVPMTFAVLPNPSVAAKSKSLLNTDFVREVTQKLLSIRHLNHFCDLVCDLVSAVSDSHNMLMASESDPNVTKMSGSDGLSKSSTVEHGNLMSVFCESVSTLEVGHCSAADWCDNKESVPVVNHTGLDVANMNKIVNKQKVNAVKPENLVPLLYENIMEMTVENCSTESQAIHKESVDMNDVCHNYSSEEMRPGMKNKLKNVDNEMVTRKQRRINKHSKKRKRRMRKKEKMSAHSREKDTSTKIEVPLSTSSQIKCRNGFARSVENRTMFHDLEDSDEDFCIIFDEVDSSCDIVHKSMSAHSTIIKESSDLWIEFDSLAIVSSNSSASADCRSYSSEISIQYDSDSDVDYETDCGQIFVDAGDFDSFSGLVFLSDNVGACSVLPSQPYVHCPSFTSSTTSYELVNDCVGIYEVNKKWREITSDIDGTPRLPRRVTFAPEEELVAVFPVDIMDRKSEWEQFALERFRFKRRIDEFEKIIAPYLTCTHREKTFRRLTYTAS